MCHFVRSLMAFVCEEIKGSLSFYDQTECCMAAISCISTLWRRASLVLTLHIELGQLQFVAHTEDEADAIT